MPQQIDIQLFLIGRSGPTNELGEWLKALGVSDAGLSDMYQAPTGAAALVGAAAKRCYNSFEPGLNPNVTRVRRAWAEYLENILASGHGSVLEHVSYSFAIEGLTRVATAELNRHRAGVAISEGSMRYIRLDQMPYWLPLSLRSGGEFHQLDAAAAEATQAEFDAAFAEDQARYQRLLELWRIEDKPFAVRKRLTSLFRRIVGMGVATGGVWTLNFRALRHVIALRSSVHAEEEIAYLLTKVGYRMVQEEPELFGDFEQQGGFWVPRYPKV